MMISRSLRMFSADICPILPFVCKRNDDIRWGDMRRYKNESGNVNKIMGIQTTLQKSISKTTTLCNLNIPDGTKKTLPLSLL
jgi:hypothetical protein